MGLPNQVRTFSPPFQRSFVKKLVMHLKSIVILDYFIKFTTSIVVRRQIVKRIFLLLKSFLRFLQPFTKDGQKGQSYFFKEVQIYVGYVPRTTRTPGLFGYPIDGRDVGGISMYIFNDI